MCHFFCLLEPQEFFYSMNFIDKEPKEFFFYSESTGMAGKGFVFLLFTEDVFQSFVMFQYFFDHINITNL